MSFMPRTHYLIAGIIYFCNNIIILFASICEYTTLYNHTYPFSPGSAPVTLVKPLCTFELDFFHPKHLDLPLGCYRGHIPTIMKEVPANSPLPDALPAQDFNKLGFVYTTVLGIANHLVPHTGSWCPWATAVNYLVRIAPIVPDLPLLWESSWTLDTRKHNGGQEED
ncbi:hypothetical protein DSO57_1024369 [Entomophthora muscae]|uniref:Uncharacterized protein n=1 Tax=Entomophthora muscae TaxID=34485 RepID=A0ACC2S4G1_9FUNG|nr:hypothetical protein DSO57_1024369 [Entomophthora muscae]